jgi:hypothetical protein
VSIISIPVAWGVYWVLVSQIEIAVGDTIQVGGQRHITEDFLLPYIFWPALGLVTGFLQYLLLRRYLQRMYGWIVATAFGWSLALIADRLFYNTLYATLDVDLIWLNALAIVLAGGATGLTQWLVLRRRVRHAAWWILASAISWGIVGLVTAGTLSSLPDLLAFTLVPNIATSIVLWLLLDWLPQGEVKDKDTPLRTPST